MISTNESNDAPMNKPVLPPTDTENSFEKLLSTITTTMMMMMCKKHINFKICQIHSPTKSNFPLTTFLLYLSVGKYPRMTSMVEYDVGPPLKMFVLDSCVTRISTSSHDGIHSHTNPFFFRAFVHGAITIDKSS